METFKYKRYCFEQQPKHISRHQISLAIALRVIKLKIEERLIAETEKKKQSRKDPHTNLSEPKDANAIDRILSLSPRCWLFVARAPNPIRDFVGRLRFPQGHDKLDHS